MQTKRLSLYGVETKWWAGRSARGFHRTRWPGRRKQRKPGETKGARALLSAAGGLAREIRSALGGQECPPSFRLIPAGRGLTVIPAGQEVRALCRP